MKSIAELRAEVKDSITMDDLVEAIIFKSEQTRIPKSQAFLQQAFFSIKQEMPSLFGEFIFDESGVTPFSDELDSVLFRLEASAILSTLNPTYRNYTVANSPEQLKRAYQKFNQDSAEIDRCASMFSELVSRQVE